ncbi:MAG: hypothetical protein SGPRY_008792 [Prymnesium sp.]
MLTHACSERSSQLSSREHSEWVDLNARIKANGIEGLTRLDARSSIKSDDGVGHLPVHFDQGCDFSALPPQEKTQRSLQQYGGSYSKHSLAPLAPPSDPQQVSLELVREMPAPPPLASDALPGWDIPALLSSLPLKLQPSELRGGKQSAPSTALDPVAMMQARASEASVVMSSSGFRAVVAMLLS